MTGYKLRPFRIESCALALLATGAVFVLSAARAGTANEIVSANLAATGADAIARIDNFTSTGRVTVELQALGKLEGTIEAVRVPGRAYFETVDLGFFSMQKGWDGAQGWERGPKGLRLLDATETGKLALQSFPSAFVAFEQLPGAGFTIQRLDDAELDGRPHYVLEVSADGSPPLTVYIDRQTNLVSRSVSRPDADEAPTVVDVGVYEAFQGVMMPTSVTVTVEGTSTARLLFENTVVNTAVDESIFAMPGEGAQRD